MNEFKMCPVCGTETRPYSEGRTTGLECPNCGWSLLTTSTPPILLDTNTYQIFLVEANSRKKNHLKAVAKAAGSNFLDARKLMKQEEPMIFEGKACEVNQIRKEFNELLIKYRIEPEFSYGE